MSERTVIDRMALAIMDFEGYWEGSVSFTNRNPGNIKFADQHNNVGKDFQGHTVFMTFEDGWRALVNQLDMMFHNRSHVYNNEMTLYDVFRKYAEGNSDEYARFVAARLGVEATTKLKDIEEGRVLV